MSHFLEGLLAGYITAYVLYRWVPVWRRRRSLVFRGVPSSAPMYIAFDADKNVELHPDGTVKSWRSIDS